MCRDGDMFVTVTKYPDPIVTLKLLPKDLVVRRKLSIFATDTMKKVSFRAKSLRVSNFLATFADEYET